MYLDEQLLNSNEFQLLHIPLEIGKALMLTHSVLVDMNVFMEYL